MYSNNEEVCPPPTRGSGETGELESPKHEIGNPVHQHF